MEHSNQSLQFFHHNVLTPDYNFIPRFPISAEGWRNEGAYPFETLPPLNNFSSDLVPNFPPPPLILKSESLKQTDKVWINKWTQGLRIKRSCPTTKIPSVKISTYRQNLKVCGSKLRELESMYNCLLVLKKTLGPEEWAERCKELEKKKEEFNMLLNELSGENLKKVAVLLKERSKKRKREKLKRIERQEQLREAKIFREREHHRIDMWLEKMKDQVEKTKREEQIKFEADLILSEVTHKKSEAKRTIALLNTLNKLRSARVQALVARGETASQSQINTFNEVIEKLKRYWVDQLKEYNLEEQGLRVMLTDAEIEQSDVKLSIKKDILKAWRSALFGKEGSVPSHWEPQTIEDLYQIRWQWDKYVCAEDTIMASTIPLGWVIPCEPSNKDWEQLLNK